MVKGHIANFGTFPDVFEFLRFYNFFRFSKKSRLWGYSWSTLLWYRCYYPHRSRDAFSPVCGIFPYKKMLQNVLHSKLDPPWPLHYSKHPMILSCFNVLSVMSVNQLFINKCTNFYVIPCHGCHNTSPAPPGEDRCPSVIPQNFPAVGLYPSQ